MLRKKMNTLKFLTTFFILISTQSQLWADQVLNFEAQYIIPVTSPLEAHYSHYKLQDYQVRIYDSSESKKSQLKYTLPAEMIGEFKEITLDLVANHDGEKFLSGEFATAKCLGAWNELKCEMRFHDLPIDLTLVETNLREKGVLESEIKTRLQILSRFSGDPIGFTEITQALSL